MYFLLETSAVVTELLFRVSGSPNTFLFVMVGLTLKVNFLFTGFPRR